MLNIDSLEKGLVIDHIQAGRSMEIYRVLELDKLDCSVAIIKNARSKKTERKDIIKIEDRIDIDLDVLGFIDPHITVNIIDGGKIIEKKQMKLPERVTNVAVSYTHLGRHGHGGGRPEGAFHRSLWCRGHL